MPFITPPRCAARLMRTLVKKVLTYSRDQSEEKEQHATPHKSTRLRFHLDLLLSFGIDL